MPSCIRRSLPKPNSQEAIRLTRAGHSIHRTAEVSPLLDERFTRFSPLKCNHVMAPSWSHIRVRPLAVYESSATEALSQRVNASVLGQQISAGDPAG